MVEDLHYFNEEQDVDPHQCEKSDPDPRQSEKYNADLHQSEKMDVEPQHWVTRMF